ncbi:BLUF domain-containing protein [Actinoplanes awajinensis]|uniref:BLUF domain-containing protein n=1 Tax=Actinoplanes awajinensis subsp. mycoplanecinus TaxID=135947 RepID=A0A101JFB3_9ACTN|nr:BLUF domain-containing protein [Actinoplanes awajinensis]KUL25679.1 hypothetical protein ADL15_40035 [Actinoplanes awajinensis subsp. mycoplanecinus]
MNLIRLIYISTKNTLPEGEIFRIQEQARHNNARDDLTGMLLFNRAYFLQYLEGDREQVTRAFTVIAADTRHCKVNILHVADIAERSYPDWSMGLLDSASPSVRGVLNEVLPGGLFLPDNLTCESAIRVVQRTRSLHLTH